MSNIPFLYFEIVHDGVGLTYNRKKTLINACQSKKETFAEIDVIIEPIIKFIAGHISYVYAFLELFSPNTGIIVN